MRRLVDVPPNFFAIPFGLAGLGAVWRLEAAHEPAPSGISDALFLTAALAWLTITLACLARWARAPRLIFGELTDSVLAPFWAIPLIVGMQLSVGLQPHAAGVARIGFEIFRALTVLFGGWLTGQWLTGQLKPGQLHPGYFLATVAGGLIGAQGAATFGLTGTGLDELRDRDRVLAPARLARGQPADAVRAPAARSPSNARDRDRTPSRRRRRLLRTARHKARHARPRSGRLHRPDGDRSVALRSIYLRQRFVPGFWSFTFSWCAVAALALRWLNLERPAGAAALADIATAAVSLLVAAIAARSLIAISEHTFLPPPPSPPDVSVQLRAEVEGIALAERAAG